MILAIRFNPGSPGAWALTALRLDAIEELDTLEEGEYAVWGGTTAQVRDERDSSNTVPRGWKFLGSKKVKPRGMEVEDL
jgi:hypothetical protein